MLTGTHVILRSWHQKDLELFTSIRNDMHTQLSLLSCPKPNSESRTLDWLKTRSSAEDGVFFVIADAETSTGHGFIEVREMHRVHRHGKLAIALALSSRGKGLARESIELLERFVRDVFNLRKLLLECSGENAAAIKLYLAVGFTIVGTLQSHHYQSGKFLNVVLMEKILAD